MTNRNDFHELVLHSEKVLGEGTAPQIWTALNDLVMHCKKVSWAQMSYQVRSEGLTLLLSPFVDAILAGDDQACFAAYLKILEYTRTMPRPMDIDVAALRETLATFVSNETAERILEKIWPHVAPRRKTGAIPSVVP